MTGAVRVVLDIQGEVVARNVTYAASALLGRERASTGLAGLPGFKPAPFKKTRPLWGEGGFGKTGRKHPGKPGNPATQVGCD
jgi:hypothetical protein